MANCDCGLTAYRSFGRLWVVIVDADDGEALNQYAWSIYLRGPKRPAVVRWRTMRLHRILMCPPPLMVVDHINSNPLDNRRCNLRIASKKENARNKRAPSSAYAPYKGIYLRHAGWWSASIEADGVRYRLGTYKNPVEAARAYDRAAKKLHGAFAKTNETLGLLPPNLDVENVDSDQWSASEKA